MSSTDQRPTGPAATAPRYSVIVPCYDESESLPALAQRLEALRQTLRERGELEVVLVDDGSTDGTAEHAKRLFDGWPSFHVVRHERNRGIGAAFGTGFAAARGEILGTLDADGSYDPLLLASLFRLVEEGADLATASPYHPDGEVEGVSGWRLFLSRGVSWLYSLVLPGRVYTYTSCFRAYRADVARALSPTRRGFDSTAEMMCRALLAGYRVAEVPARLSTRRHGTTKMRVGKEIRNHLRSLANIWLRRGPYRHAVEERR